MKKLQLLSFAFLGLYFLGCYFFLPLRPTTLPELPYNFGEGTYFLDFTQDLSQLAITRVTNDSLSVTSMIVIDPHTTKTLKPILPTYVIDSQLASLNSNEALNAKDLLGWMVLGVFIFIYVLSLLPKQKNTLTFSKEDYDKLVEGEVERRLAEQGEPKSDHGKLLIIAKRTCFTSFFYRMNDVTLFAILTIE